MDHLAASPVSACQIREHTSGDLILMKVKKLVQSGSPMELPDTKELQQFHNWRLELSIE